MLTAFSFHDGDDAIISFRSLEFHLPLADGRKDGYSILELSVLESTFFFIGGKFFMSISQELLEKARMAAMNNLRV